MLQNSSFEVEQFHCQLIFAYSSYLDAPTIFNQISIAISLHCSHNLKLNYNYVNCIETFHLKSSKAHFPCFRLLYLYIIENISAHRHLIQFIEILRQYLNF